MNEPINPQAIVENVADQLGVAIPEVTESVEELLKIEQKKEAAEKKAESIQDQKVKDYAEISRKLNNIAISLHTIIQKIAVLSKE